MRLRRRSEAPRKRRRIRKLRLLALVLVLLLLAGGAFTFGLVRAVASEIPSLDPAEQRGASAVDSVIYAAPDANGNRRVLAVLRGDESRVLVTRSEDVAPIMRQAIVAVEDKRFWEHNGVDVRGILRALWQDIRNREVLEGGSTITQQFVKNAYVRNEKTVARKVREAALAWQLTQQWSKERILLAYLNTIYFGNGAYGIQQAARTYFGKGASRLALHEAALLAGLPSNPSAYDPVQHPRSARNRRHYVLETLVDQGKISRTAMRAADAKPLPEADDVRLPGTQGPAQYFVNYVKDQLVSDPTFGPGRVFGGGIKVTTTIDLGLQELAREAIAKVLDDPEGPQAALVAIDPIDGSVKVMVGGTNFRRSQFNLATQAERQPGSSFKPIVLATAMRQGISTQTTFESKPIRIDAGDRVWKVTNYENAYLGRVDLGRAMVSSDNAVYAQLAQLVRPRAIVQTAKALGIRTDLPEYFSLGLGQVAVNPLEMARAYATIANGGIRVDGSLLGDRPRVVDTVEYVRTGRSQRNLPRGRRVLAQDEAASITAILQNVVRQGTGRRAGIPGVPVAGKTGTTDNYGDAWFVGYTPSLVVAVWVGYPDALRPMLTEFGGEPVSGGTLPALIWKEFVSRVTKARETTRDAFPDTPYLPATNQRVVWRGGSYRRDNGYCPNTRVIAYVVGRAPAAVADCKPNEVTVPVVVGRSVESARTTLEERPLGVEVIEVPAEAKQRPGVVVKQYPKGGFLSSGDTVQLVVTRAAHGLVPNLVGSSVAAARALLRKLGIRPRIEYADGPPGTVLEQTPRAGVAAAPGLAVSLVVARGTSSATP